MSWDLIFSSLDHSFSQHKQYNDSRFAFDQKEICFVPQTRIEMESARSMLTASLIKAKQRSTARLLDGARRLHCSRAAPRG